MKTITVFALLIFVTMAANDANLWEEFKKKHSKSYKNLSEEKQRFSVFRANLRFIEEHNAKYENGQETYYMGINKFADMTHKEFESLYLSHIEQPQIDHGKILETPRGVVVPDAIDWREKGVVTPVKYQGACGSCWAFSGTGAVESQYAIRHGVKVVLSEQELVDCYRRDCKGSTAINAYRYIKSNGISTNESYPYVSDDGVAGICMKGKDSGVKVIDYVTIPQNEEALKHVVGVVGPASVHVNASGFSMYAGGIFNYPQCGQGINHAMLAVGYGSQNGHDYWIVKNSWGDGWGDKGYIYMSRNRNQQCGIGINQYYPIIQ